MNKTLTSKLLTSKLLRFFTPKWGTEGGIILFLLSWLRAFSPKDPFKHRCYISQSFFAFYLEVHNADSHVPGSKVFRLLLHPFCPPPAPRFPPVHVTLCPRSGIAPHVVRVLLETSPMEAFAFQPEVPGEKLLPPPYFCLLSQIPKLFQWKGMVARILASSHGR